MDPRIVMIRRETAYESLLREHGTIQMAKYRLSKRGESLDEIRQSHQSVMDAAEIALGCVPTVWRKTWLLRRDLDRFRFDPEDIIVAVGLDGLVPNVAKYLNGQPVIGVNPTPWPQRMMHFEAPDLPHLYASAQFQTEQRTMVQVDMGDGRRLLALNEVFCGHSSHQSAKYDIEFAGTTEYQSSSGLIVTTGTGATGWASSITAATGVDHHELPQPTDPLIFFLVREAWVSSFTGGSLLRGQVGHGKPSGLKTKKAVSSKVSVGARGPGGRGGQGVQSEAAMTRSPNEPMAVDPIAATYAASLPSPKTGETLRITSKMPEGGILFGDGIESDALGFSWGESAEFRASERCLSLVVG